MSVEKFKEPVRGHLFTVDILIESDSNGRALEQLLRLLNTPEIKDYRIQKGIELGKTIDIALQQQKADAAKKDAGKKADESPVASVSGGGKPSDAKKEPAAARPHAPSALATEIERYKTNNTLVRITVVKGKGIKFSMPCRILNYDVATQNVSIYHVDEKKVYLFRLNEIDDLHAG
jgi:hypothetical protein